MSTEIRRGRKNTKKATFSLHSDVLRALDEIMVDGKAKSKNAFVEQAIVKELGELRRQARLAAWQQAAKDPLFLKDMADVDAEFGTADAETARKIL